MCLQIGIYSQYIPNLLNPSSCTHADSAVDDCLLLFGNSTSCSVHVVNNKKMSDISPWDNSIIFFNCQRSLRRPKVYLMSIINTNRAFPLGTRIQLLKCHNVMPEAVFSLMIYSVSLLQNPRARPGYCLPDMILFCLKLNTCQCNLIPLIIHILLLRMSSIIRLSK